MERRGSRGSERDLYSIYLFLYNQHHQYGKRNNGVASTGKDGLSVWIFINHLCPQVGLRRKRTCVCVCVCVWVCVCVCVREREMCVCVCV
jgi:hypothetical protein